MKPEPSTKSNPDECGASTKDLRRHTEPTVPPDGDTRTPQSSCEGHSPSVTRKSSSDSSSSCHDVKDTSTSDSTGETQSLHGSKKRKSTWTESEEGPRKRGRGSLNPSQDQSLRASSPCEDAGVASAPIVVSSSTDSEERKRKRKSEETEVPRKRSKKDPSEDLNQPTPCSDGPGTSSTASTPRGDSREAFEAKYQSGELLGEGGFGAVYAGYRAADNVPVAIKVIPEYLVGYSRVLLDGEMRIVPREVTSMLHLKPAAGESIAVALLDWYDLEEELILVLERPAPCCDLFRYMKLESAMSEHKAKLMSTQLLDGLIEIQSKGVYHQDVKPDNILLETGSEVPRVRLIDFGLAEIVSERESPINEVTRVSASRLSYLQSITHMQFTDVVCTLLDVNLPYERDGDVITHNPELKETLSIDGQSFLRTCLSQTPSTLMELREHPWMKLSTLELQRP